MSDRWHRACSDSEHVDYRLYCQAASDKAAWPMVDRTALTLFRQRRQYRDSMSDQKENDSSKPMAVAGVSVLGAIERVDAGVAVGWVHDERAFGKPLNIQICAAGQVLAEGCADEYRTALANAGIGNGSHGFRLPLRVPFDAGTRITLVLRHADTGVNVAAHGYAVTCRHPLCVKAGELDAHSLLGQAPVRRPVPPKPRVGRLQRWKRRLLSVNRRPVQQPPARPVENAAKPQPTGTELRLEWMRSTVVSDAAALQQWPTLTLPAVDAPLISIIIPVHNQFQVTWQCLASLAVHAQGPAFEVVLVDDCSTDATTAIETHVRHLRVIRNESNLGFLHNCNKAASQARGRYLLFLNNDTEVTAGWLDELLVVFDRFATVGAVGSRLVYPDGRLQDAGGIVWNTAVPWNVGHGEQPDDPRFNYVRDVDYLTGAALMVSTEAWQRVGGFTTDYEPAYYEDTDLAFKLREAGYRTLYCPQSTVIHYEGWSNGTSLDSGVKQHQRLNATRFVERWKPSCSANGDEGVDLHINKDRGQRWRVLMIDNNYPRFGNDAGSYAAIQEIRLLQGLGCKVTFMPHNLQHMGEHVVRLQRLGVECIYAPHTTRVGQFLQQRGQEFDVVYITRYTVAEALLDDIARHTRARVIFNNADLHFLREMRGTLLRQGTDLTAVRRTRERELGVMARVDAVLSYNEIEHHVIASHLLRSDHIFKCPWVLHRQPLTRGFHERQGIAFLGGFGHPPNREAVDWFIDNVIPGLQSRDPSIRLQIWGSGIPDDIAWHNDPRVDVRGYATDLREVFDECRVFVAPLQSGAGIKGKVLDSIAHGVPAVLSPVASEATGLVHDSSTLIAETPQAWVEHILYLYNDVKRWSAFSGRAQALCDTEYSYAMGLERMRTVFDALGLKDEPVPQAERAAA